MLFSQHYISCDITLNNHLVSGHLLVSNLENINLLLYIISKEPARG